MVWLTQVNVWPPWPVHLLMLKRWLWHVTYSIYLDPSITIRKNTATWTPISVAIIWWICRSGTLFQSFTNNFNFELNELTEQKWGRICGLYCFSWNQSSTGGPSTQSTPSTCCPSAESARGHCWLENEPRLQDTSPRCLAWYNLRFGRWCTSMVWTTFQR